MTEQSAFHFQKLPTLVRTAQVVGIASAAFLSGGIASISWVLVPTINQAPAPLLAQQWRAMYNVGAKTAPWFALTGGISFSYLMWEQGKIPLSLVGTELDPNTTFCLYSAAAILIPAIVPFTILGMKNINGKLHAKAALSQTARPGDDVWNEIGVAENDKTKTLVCEWAKWNAVRSVMTGVGAVCGLLAVVLKPEVVGLEIKSIA